MGGVARKHTKGCTGTGCEGRTKGGRARGGIAGGTLKEHKRKAASKVRGNLGGDGKGQANRAASDIEPGPGTVKRSAEEEVNHRERASSEGA